MWWQEHSIHAKLQPNQIKYKAWSYLGLQKQIYIYFSKWLLIRTSVFLKAASPLGGIFRAERNIPPLRMRSTIIFCSAAERFDGIESRKCFYFSSRNAAESKFSTNHNALFQICWYCNKTKLGNKIKTLKYGAFPDIAGYDEPATLFIVEIEFPFRAIPSQRNIPFRAEYSA